TRLQKATSAALAVLEANGYGDPSDIGALLGFGFQKVLRDARDGFGRPMYDGGTFADQSIDPLYGVDRAHTTNLVSVTSKGLSIKGSTTSASSKVSITTRGTAPLFVGQPVEGTGIPANSVIKALVGTAGSETELE